MTNPTEEWLKEFSKSGTRYTNKRNFEELLKKEKGDNPRAHVYPIA